jgi:hypothetical protein
MPITLTINGLSYSYPETDDEDWGDEATEAMEALSGNVLYKAGGTFTLTANANFGTAFGLEAKNFISNVATGTAPLTISSTTVVSNLNADQVDGVEGTEIFKHDGTVAMTGNINVNSNDINNVANQYFPTDGIIEFGTGGATGGKIEFKNAVGGTIRFNDVPGVIRFDKAFIIQDADRAVSIDEFSTDGTLGGNSDTALPTEKAVKTYVDTEIAGVGGGSTEPNPQYAAGSFDYPASNPAPLDTDTGANGTIKRQLFDDSTDESVIGQFKVPSDIDTSGTVTFKLYGYPTTAAADDVVFDFKHSVGNNDETWDAAFTTESSGAKTCINTQDDISIFTWTETVSNLSWAASDFCRFQLTRDADNGSDTLSGDFGVIFFEVDIPRT